MLFGKEKYQSEDSIIKGCLKGKPQAQKALWDNYKSVLFGVCLRYTKTHADAEEILQEGYVKIFNSLNNYEGKGSFEGWMKRIMVFTAIDWHRKKKPEYLSENEEEEITETTEDYIEEGMDADMVLDIMQELPEGYRMVLNLYAIEGYSHKKIAEQLNISVGTSKSQLAKARKFFANKLKEVGIETGK
jgi:RNA polymerase sigma-70 factor (ECF subfamily)